MLTMHLLCCLALRNKHMLFWYPLSFQIYERYGNELCIVASNINTMTLEYFHPKTTPDMDIAVAIKCTTTVPGTIISL